MKLYTQVMSLSEIQARWPKQAPIREDVAFVPTAIEQQLLDEAMAQQQEAEHEGE